MTMQEEYEALMRKEGGHDDNDRLLALALMDVIQKRDALKESVSQLGEAMTLLAARLERDDGATVNSLGEVQSRSSAVDTKCSELTLAQQWLTRVRLHVGREQG